MPKELTFEEIAGRIKGHKIGELIDRWENDYGLWRGDPFIVDKEKGDYENCTTNSPKALGNRIINSLAYGDLKISIDIDPEASNKERNSLAIAERLVIGGMVLANARLESMREPSILDQLSWYSTIRGWVAQRVYVWQDGDTIVWDWMPWDILKTKWGVTSKGLAWASYKVYSSVEDIEETYGEKVKGDRDGKVEKHIFYDRDFEYVLHDKKFLQKPQEHGLGYVPVYIMPVGSTPLIQSDKFADSYKDQGESCYQNNRDVYPNVSLMLSYVLTQAGDETHPPIIIYYPKGSTPPDSEKFKNPYKQGRVIALEEGTDVREWMKSGLLPNTHNALNLFTQMDSRGGMAPIAYGEIDRTITASGTNMLIKVAEASLYPFKTAIEKAVRWGGNQFLEQFKSGEFDEVELQGLDSARRKFKIKPKPDDISSAWDIKVELKPDTPLDEQVNAGMAINLTEKKLWSRQRGMDKVGVEDTESELSTIDREDADELMAFKMKRIVAALLKDRKGLSPEEKADNEETAFMILSELRARMGAPQAESVSGIPEPPNPELMVASNQRIPRPEDINARMAKLNLERG